MPRSSHQFASSPSASSNRPLRAPSPNTTDKSALLSALAQELKLSKLSADESAQSMIKLESLIEEKHSSFLSEQSQLSHLRDRNHSEITSLRKKLASLQSQLVEAQNVQEEEAQIYLSLLSGKVEGLQFSDSTISTTPRPSSHELAQPHSQGTRFHSTLPVEYGVTLSPTSTTPIENPYQRNSRESSLHHSRMPYHPRATSEFRDPASVVKRSDWQESVFEQEGGKSSGWKGILRGGLSMKRKSSKPE
ncbi:hypothetical protein JCM5353_001171 [Sporobolomyces roseus]